MESEEWRVKSGEWRVESGEWRVSVAGKRPVTWLHSIFVVVSGKRLVTWSHSFNVRAKINKMLDVSITKLSTLH